MGAELLTIGTELLLGQIVDTNAAWMAQRLAEAGIDVYYKSTVGDNWSRIEAAIRLAMSRADVIVMTGGLGPTEDDLTATSWRPSWAGRSGWTPRLDCHRTAVRPPTSGHAGEQSQASHGTGRGRGAPQPARHRPRPLDPAWELCLGLHARRALGDEAHAVGPGDPSHPDGFRHGESNRVACPQDLWDQRVHPG